MFSPFSTVLPAYAGMFPYLSIKRNVTRSSPRVCGDVSMKLTKNRLTRRFSPRMRGCFQGIFQDTQYEVVLPAYAGMFLVPTAASQKNKGSPRVCGDVSLQESLKVPTGEFSPRMRGCFRADWEQRRKKSVLPAYAGMFLQLIQRTF